MKNFYITFRLSRCAILFIAALIPFHATLNAQSDTSRLPMDRSAPKTTLENAAGKTLTVTGKVISGEDNKPLSNVSVFLKGTNSGTTTNENGTFTFTTKTGAVLEFSSVGYNTADITVTDAVLNVKLSAGKKLDEVVVVGYGTQRKKDLTSAINHRIIQQ
jgi:hypothetical protein